MKKILLIFAVFNIGLTLMLVGLYYLAVAYPFHPGDILFGVQSAAENELIHLTGDPVRRVEMHFDLVERRLANISMAQSDRQLDLALNAYDQCLSEAICSIQAVPEVQAQDLYAQVGLVLLRTDIVLSGLSSPENSASLAQIAEKIQALQSAASSTEIQDIVKKENYFPSEIIARVIPFFGKDVDHGEFPMGGGHEQAECLECHEEGSYADTPLDCVSCHTLERDLAPVTSRVYDQFLPLAEHNAIHYSDACADCHGVDDWASIDYDHAQVRRCNACHLADIPQAEEAHSLPKVFWNVAYKTSRVRQDPSMKHYPGDCSACHQDTESWEIYTFSHNDSCKTCHGALFGMVDLSAANECSRSETCESCHIDENHEEDYPGDCTNCHNDVKDWLNVLVDHSTYTNCYQCHSDDRPAEHYSGSCNLCHSTATWKLVFNYHETGSNCQTCHQSPEKHSTEKCSTCHNTNDWLDHVKDHDSNNCSSCHNAPDDHYTPNCAECHNSSDWGTVTFSHDQPLDCVACHTQPVGHYSGSCLNCHSTETWQPVRFDHSGQTNCVACHTSPPAHYTSSCSDCHSTDDWSVGSDVLHTMFSNCANCHAAPLNHWPAECSDCHSTLRWGVDIGLLHIIYSDCVSCHSTPTGHWPGECTNCHNTSSWAQVRFDHTGYTDCKACHDRPGSHPRGQCSRCHDTDSWAVEEEVTETATDTQTPRSSETRGPSPEPSETPTPSPEPSETPGPSPEPSETPTPFDELVPSETPAPSDTPAPGDTPVPSETPESGDTPVPSETPEPSDTLAPDDTPVPYETPEPSDTPASDDTPVPSETPEPSDTPASDDTPVPSETLAPSD